VRACPTLLVWFVLNMLPPVAPSAHAADRDILGEVLIRSFDSPILGRSMDYALYLPPGYHMQTESRFPAVYLLHGVNGNERSWIRFGKAAETASRLIARGEITPMVLIMPGVGRSWYVDNPDPDAAGPVETALVSDLIRHIDSWVRTLPTRAGRAVAGLSMGGYGALRLAFRYPDLFTATAALSPAIFPQIGSPDALGARQVHLFHGAFGHPFDPHRFNALNPFTLVPSLADLTTPPAIYLSVGKDDYFGLEDGTKRLYRALERHGLAAELRILDGDHSWRFWARELPAALRFLDRALQRAANDAP